MSQNKQIHALIVANMSKPKVSVAMECCSKELEKRGISYFVTEPAHFKLPERATLTDLDKNYHHKKTDFIIAVGGDGTFLYTARTFLDFQLPIIGVNAGRVGFLMEVAPEELPEALDKFLSGQAGFKKRMLLCAEVIRNHKLIYKVPFLNDAVVSKGSLSRMIELTLSLDGEILSRYRSDGMIVATPTGSTAYNLAAGGPILTPDFDGMIITPICPHILGVRPIVTDATKSLSLCFESGEEDTTLTVDGQENVYLKTGDRIEIKKSEKPVILFDYGEKQFFAVLGNKLGWHL